MEVWKIIFLSKWVICMFHVNLPGCTFRGSLSFRQDIPTLIRLYQGNMDVSAADSCIARVSATGIFRPSIPLRRISTKHVHLGSIISTHGIFGYI